MQYTFYVKLYEAIALYRWVSIDFDVLAFVIIGSSVL